MYSSAIQAQAATLRAPLKSNFVKLEVAVAQHRDEADPDPLNSAESRVKSAETLVQLAAASVKEKLQHFADASKVAAKVGDLFKLDHKLLRPLKTPDTLKTLLLITTGWTLETIFTTISLVADGHLDLIPALGFGATFSTATVGLGLLCGQVLRFVGYRRACTIQKPEDKVIRRIALGGFSATLLVELVMIFVGGRVRVTGGHDEIFDFSEIGFAQTFNDGLALVIMVSAALSFLIAVAKGYSGFTDPVPGYADHAGRTAEEIFDRAEEMIEDTLVEIEEVAEAAEDELLDVWEGSEDADDLREQIILHNANVEDAKDTLRVFATAEWEQHAVVGGVDTPFPELDFSAFDALQVDPERLLFAVPKHALIDKLRQSQSQAANDIAAAFAAFAADVRGHVVLPPIPPSHTKEV